MTEEERRERRLQLLDDHIGRALAAATASGELASAPSWGKPLAFGDGYDETPDALKMPFKLLKEAGYVPPEVGLMREIAALQADLAAHADDADDTDAGRARRQRLADLRQQLALRLEQLRRSGTL